MKNKALETEPLAYPREVLVNPIGPAVTATVIRKDVFTPAIA